MPHLKEKLVKLESEMQRLAAMEKLMLASPDQQISLTDPDSRSMETSGRGSEPELEAKYCLSAQWRHAFVQ